MQNEESVNEYHVYRLNLIIGYFTRVKFSMLFLDLKYFANFDANLGIFRRKYFVHQNASY